MWKRTILTALALAPVAALADVQYDEAPVIDVEPIVERIERVEPKERCWFERVRVQDAAPNTTAPLVGALIGGAIGNAVGHKKRNKQVGAVVGAVLGGSIGHDIGRRKAQARRSSVRVARQEVCEIVEETKYRERVTGYLVTYRYGGETHRARMATHPGDRIRVRVRVTPA